MKEDEEYEIYEVYVEGTEEQYAIGRSKRRKDEETLERLTY